MNVLFHTCTTVTNISLFCFVPFLCVQCIIASKGSIYTATKLYIIFGCLSVIWINHAVRYSSQLII